MADLFASKQKSTFSLQSLVSLKNNQSPPENLPPVLYDYYASPIVYPPWYDEQRVINAQHFASRHLPQIVLALGFHSLPLTYGFRGAKLLQISEDLTQHVNARTLKTAQFVFDVLQPGSFDPSTGQGIRTVQTIRLIHAAARTHHGAKYDKAMHGLEPINQFEMIATLYGAFYLLTKRGIKKSGMDYTEQERKDYMHLWSVVGYWLGIDEELLIIDDDERVVEEKLWANIWKYELNLSLEVTKPLTEALLGCFKDMIPVPFHLADDVVYSFLRYYLGDEWCDKLELPKGPDLDRFFAIMTHLNQEVEEFKDHHVMMARILEKVSVLFMHKWMELESGQKRIPYYLQ